MINQTASKWTTACHCFKKLYFLYWEVCMCVPHQGLRLCTGPLWSGLSPPGRLASVGSTARTLWAAAAWASVDRATGSPPSWWPRAEKGVSDGWVWKVTFPKGEFWNSTSLDLHTVGLWQAAHGSVFGQEAILQVNHRLTNLFVFGQHVVVIQHHSQVLLQREGAGELKHSKKKKNKKQNWDVRFQLCIYLNMTIYYTKT